MELIDFLTTIKNALKEGESLQFNITREGDSLKMSFVPRLNKDDKEETAEIRAALALPLLFNNMPLEQISQELCQRLQGYGEARKPALDAYQELLANLGDATAKAKNTASGTASSKNKKDTKKTKTEKTPDKAAQPPKKEEPVGLLDF